MLVIPKKDFPKMLNPMGLKRGDRVEIEVGDVSPDFITLDPATLKLNGMRDMTEPREPLVKMPKPKPLHTMPMPDLKNMIQQPPMPNAGAAPMPSPTSAPMPPAPMK